MISQTAARSDCKTWMQPDSDYNYCYSQELRQKNFQGRPTEKTQKRPKK